MNEGLRPAITNLTSRSLIESRKTGASTHTYSPLLFPTRKHPDKSLAAGRQHSTRSKDVDAIAAATKNPERALMNSSPDIIPRCVGFLVSPFDQLCLVYGGQPGAHVLPRRPLRSSGRAGTLPSPDDLTLVCCLRSGSIMLPRQSLRLSAVRRIGTFTLPCTTLPSYTASSGPGALRPQATFHVV
jgi:hypothetical protein